MQTDRALGIFSWFGYELSFGERLRLIKESGFDATSIWWGDEEETYRNGLGKTMPSMVRDHGLILDYIHVPFERCNDLWSDSLLQREHVVLDYLRWVQTCAECESPAIVMHVSRGSELGAPNVCGIESMSRIVQAAEQAGVTVAVENTTRIDYLTFVFDMIQSPCLRLCYDSGHDWLWGNPPAKVLDAFGHLLLCTHLSDNNGLEDQHYLPGRGVVDWEVLSGSFPSRDYTGTLLLEVFPTADERLLSPATFLSQAFDEASRLREIFSG